MSVILEPYEPSPDFNKLKSELLDHPDGPALFEDYHFPPKYNILYNKENKSKAEFAATEINWYRPGQISKQPVLIGNNNSEFSRGSLSPEWFPTLLTILKERNLFELIIPSFYFQNTFNQDPVMITPTRMMYCGTFQFTFRRGGIIENVVIDDRIPCSLNCYPIGIVSSNENEFIGALVEKAYAKYVGGYYNLQKQDFMTALMDFTGGILETVSMKGDERLTETEIENFYGKMVDLVGDSFVICRGYQGQFMEQGQRADSFMSETHLLTGVTQIPQLPPVGASFTNYIAQSLHTAATSNNNSSSNNNLNDNSTSNGNKQGPLIPVVRVKSIGNEVFSSEGNCIVSGSRIHESWNNCPAYTQRWFRLTKTNNNENTEQWIPIEDLTLFCERVIFVHLLTRNAIVAIARKQRYWKYFKFDHFWHRDGPRGSPENIGQDFLNNSQYLFNVHKEEGCTVKIVLTNVQKYVDTGANMITPISGYKTGLMILEVERNRQYLVHNLSETRMLKYHVDCQIDRSLIISSELEKGTYVIIPWLSDGSGTKFTVQVYSSAISSDAMKLELHEPTVQYCITCQIKKTAQHTSSRFNSIYRKPSDPIEETNGSESKPKSSSQYIFSDDVDQCPDCRVNQPRMATRLKLLSVDQLQLTRASQLPQFYCRVTCDKETFYSRVGVLTNRQSDNHQNGGYNSDLEFSPQWNESYLFYRNKAEDGIFKIEVFCDGKFGIKHQLGEYSFSEKELRENSELNVHLRVIMGREYIPLDSILNVQAYTYFPSEFCKI